MRVQDAKQSSSHVWFTMGMFHSRAFVDFSPFVLIATNDKYFAVKGVLEHRLTRQQRQPYSEPSFVG